LSDENESSEVAQLLEIKRGYRNELTQLEVAQRMKLAAELAEKKQALQEKYAAQLAEKISQRVVASLRPMLIEVIRDE